MLAPFYYNACRDPNSAPGIADCGTCKTNTPRLARQSLGCGYEPPAPKGMAVMPWSHEGCKEPPGDRVCAGYVCRLPEVVEVIRARKWADRGSLETFCGGPPGERVMESIEILDGAASDLERWFAKKAQEK